MLTSWGLLVHRHRWLVLALSAISTGASLWLLTRGGRFDSGLTLEGESSRAIDLMDRDLPKRPMAFDLLFAHPTLPAAAPVVRAEVERAVAPLRGDARVVAVRTPWDADPTAAERLSRDGRVSRVTVELAGHAATIDSIIFAAAGEPAYAALRPLVRSDTLTVTAAGALALHHDFIEMTTADVRRAELLILPVVPVLLLFVFGSVVAAVVPFGVGLSAVAGGMAVTTLLTRTMSVSVYAPNVVTMIGLAVAIDYSLFIVSRYREELRRWPAPEAIARTMATAGEAILFSGLTVAVGLLGLYSLELGNLGSIGLCGTVVVAFAVLYALTFLPALLAVLGPRVDAWRLPLRRLDAPPVGRGAWTRISTSVMAHPWLVIVPVAAGLLLLGAPFARIRLGASDVGMLPPSSESRRGDALLRREFPGHETTRILVVVDWRERSPLGPEEIAELHRLSRWIAGLPDVKQVQSFVDLDPTMRLDQYQMLATMPSYIRPPLVQRALEQTMGRHIALLVVHTPHAAGSDPARSLVRRIRNEHPPLPAGLLVTGHTAADVDFLSLVQEHAPRAVLLIVVATYVLLFVLLGSVLLPLKAVIINFLSISASYGALVWIFQDGHLARWLHFSPGPIETSTPLIMFCVMFGLSMDYGVLLLSRIREEYDRTGDNTVAVGTGLQHTGRLITAAAAIMATVFFAFAAADVVVIKTIGIGMGIAVVLDATIVRALLVPATMRLLGSWNWWAPGPVARWHTRFTGRLGDRGRD